MEKIQKEKIWTTILVAPKTKFKLMSLKADFEFVTYDQVINQLIYERETNNGKIKQE